MIAIVYTFYTTHLHVPGRMYYPEDRVCDRVVPVRGRTCSRGVDVCIEGTHVSSDMIGRFDTLSSAEDPILSSSLVCCL